MSAQTSPTGTSVALPGACLLAQTGVYEEYLSIRPIPALPGIHDLLVRSRLDSARDPDALHTRYRAGISREALSRLHTFLGEYLALQGGRAAGTAVVAVGARAAGEGQS